MQGGSFLDKLLVAATGSILISDTITAGQSVVAKVGTLMLCDPTGAATITIAAPPGPIFGMQFGIADVTGMSGSHPISVVSTGANYVLEHPGAPGDFDNFAQIGSAGRVRWWVFVPLVTGGTSGWKCYRGVF